MILAWAWALYLRISALRRPSIHYCAHHGQLPAVFVRTPAAKLRQNFQLPACEHYSQFYQDVFALLMNRFKAGYFVEIGANNGRV
jgi:hypothetical protein